jgi:hypothetical protein
MSYIWYVIFEPNSSGSSFCKPEKIVDVTVASQVGNAEIAPATTPTTNNIPTSHTTSYESTTGTNVAAIPDDDDSDSDSDDYKTTTPTTNNIITTTSFEIDL